jgi:threonine dehydrogenase-like Zn-dependent dehydrogenase
VTALTLPTALVATGRARPGGLDDAPKLYQQFDQREAGVIKAILHPLTE